MKCGCGCWSLQRVSSSIDSRTGELRLHLKKNYHYDTTGMRYNLPKPGKGKRYEGELLLREDQLLYGVWRQKSRQAAKALKSSFGEDITADVRPCVRLCLCRSSEVFLTLASSADSCAGGLESEGAGAAAVRPGQEEPEHAERPREARKEEAFVTASQELCRDCRVAVSYPCQFWIFQLA